MKKPARKRAVRAAGSGGAPRSRVADALRSWKRLNAVIMTLTEAELTQALTIERANKRRHNIMTRLNQRLFRVRANKGAASLRRNP